MKKAHGRNTHGDLRRRVEKSAANVSDGNTGEPRALNCEKEQPKLQNKALERARKELQKLRAHLAQSVEAEKQARLLSHRLFEAQDRERRVVGLALHDEVGSFLVMLKLAVRHARKKVSEDAGPELDEIERIANEAAEQIRAVSSTMRPTMLDDFGLPEAVRWYLERYEKSTGIRPRFNNSGLESRLPAEIENVAFRIVQEALTNVTRHAEAGSVNVGISCGKGVLTLSVEDNGMGFDPKSVGKGSGLGTMRDLAALAGGSLVIDSCPGEGTRITARLPCPAKKETGEGLA